MHVKPGDAPPLRVAHLHGRPALTWCDVPDRGPWRMDHWHWRRKASPALSRDRRFRTCGLPGAGAGAGHGARGWGPWRSALGIRPQGRVGSPGRGWTPGDTGLGPRLRGLGRLPTSGPERGAPEARWGRERDAGVPKGRTADGRSRPRSGPPWGVVGAGVGAGLGPQHTQAPTINSRSLGPDKSLLGASLRVHTSGPGFTVPDRTPPVEPRTCNYPSPSP